MNLGVSFAPLVPDYVVWAAFGASVVIAALLLLARSRGALLRAAALGLMVLALANPSCTREDRDPIPSVAAVIVDKSPSQDFGDRNKQTAEARKAIVDRLTHIPGLGVRVADHGINAGTAQVTVRRDGEVLESRNVAVGSEVKIDVPIPHAGQNIVEVEAAPVPNELTQVNNRAVLSIDGVRDKLRVLLVSGEPHAGERTWRNQKKTDATVDLVHFTILRR